MVTRTISAFLAANRIRRLVVAISGGPDSTALLVALAELKAEVVAAHVNHHLRGEESNDDERFVRELCARFGVELHVADGTLDPEAIRRHGIEAAAREVRHARLHEIRDAVGARWIATAHQLDDQAETIVMRMMTGSGLAGLRGIHPIRDDGVVRPLLEVTRAEVEEFLRERNIVARSDSSNRDPRFLRNRVRATLHELPESVSRNLASVAEQSREHWALVERTLDEYEVEQTEDQTRFLRWPDDAWLRQALLHRHIRRLDPHSRDVSAADLERLAKATRRTSVTKALELIGDVLRKRQARAPVLHFECIIKPGESRYIEEIDTTISLTAQPRNHATAQPFQLPPGEEPTFTIRNRKPGDRFRPLGMSHEKNLKDFLIDRKIAVELRDRIPLLIWNGQIVWVGGIGISDAFKVTDPAGGQYAVWLERAGASVEATEGQANLHR
jgi:tRNA(Ile)-lysidine synthase